MTQTVLLGDICTKITDGAHWSPKSTDDGYPMASVKDMLDNRINIETCRKISEEDYRKLVNDGCRPEKNDVLIAKDGSYLKHMFVSDGVDDVVLLSSIAILRPDTTLVDPRFLAYYIRNQRDNYDLSQYVSGAAIPRIILKNFARMPINLPDLDTQKKIADVLGTIDEKIELNRRMNETLEQMGQALFRHYFIDNPEAEMWEEKPLDEIADFLNGLAMQKYPRVDGESILPVIKIREMSSGITTNTDIANANIPEQYIVHNGDLLFSWSGTLLVKFWSEGDGALNQHLFKVTSKEYPEWLYYYWTKHHLDDFIQTAKSKATTMGHIQRKHLKQAMVRVPNADTTQEIGDQIQPLIDEGKENAKQIQTLTTLRDTLLPRLISGKINLE